MLNRAFVTNRAVQPTTRGTEDAMEGDRVLELRTKMARRYNRSEISHDSHFHSALPPQIARHQNTF